MSRICRFFVLLIAAYTVAGCTPVGSIGGSGAGDFLLAVPKSPKYEVGNTFNPIRDLKVYVPSQGLLKEISLNLVTISVSEPPYTPNELKIIPFDTDYPLQKPVRYVFVVEYLALTASCYVDVSSAAGSEAVSGIHIIWAK
jgi:hypothetical protein